MAEKQQGICIKHGTIGGHLFAKLGSKGFGALLDGMYRRCK